MEANSVLLQKKYVRIVALFAEQMQLTLDEALEFFYRSETYKRLADESDKVLSGTYKGKNVSPWRCAIIADDLTALVNSDLLTNLCPAPEAGRDFSWVKPGRCLWQWWSVGAPRYEDQKAWFDAFFEDGGCLRFVRRASDGYPTGTDNVKVGRERQVRLTLIVNWQGLAELMHTRGLKTTIGNLQDL